MWVGVSTLAWAYTGKKAGVKSMLGCTLAGSREQLTFSTAYSLKTVTSHMHPHMIS